MQKKYFLKKEELTQKKLNPEDKKGQMNRPERTMAKKYEGPLDYGFLDL